MKRFFRNNGILVVIAALLLTAIISLSSVFLPGLTRPVRHAFTVLGTPFRAVSTYFVDKVEAAYSYAFSYRTLQQRVDELEQQVADMAEENRTARAALEENERLRELLKLSQKRNDLTFEMASVTARGSNSWDSTLTISKGTSDGVETGMCVITETGSLVGVVSDAGGSWATVTTLIDPAISMGACVEESSENCILTGDLNAMSRGLCCLSYLEPDAVLAEGDTVLTSGLGGVYPAGIVIGTVQEEGLASSGMERYAMVQPAADLDALEQVFVIKAFDVVE